MLVEWMKCTFHTQRSPIQPSLTQKLSKSHTSPPPEPSHLFLSHPKLTQLSGPEASPLQPSHPQTHRVLKPWALTPVPLTLTAHTLSPHLLSSHAYASYTHGSHSSHTPRPHPYSPHSPLTPNAVMCRCYTLTVAERQALTFRMIKEIILRVWHRVNTSSLVSIHNRLTCLLLNQCLAREASKVATRGRICLGASPD